MDYDRSDGLIFHILILVHEASSVRRVILKG
jgi:hypothetical protein